MADQRELADVIKSITTDVTTIVKGEIELAKAELMPQAKSAGIGAGLFGAAGYFALTAGTLLFLSMSFGMSVAFYTFAKTDVLCSLAWGFAVMAILLLALAGVLALIGKNKIEKDVTGPTSTVAQAEASVSAITTALTRGKENVDALSLSDPGPRQIG